MADEAVQVEGPYTQHDYTVNDASGIPQFTLCELLDPRTAVASQAATSGEPFAGIAMIEKEASDGQTNLGLTKVGFFDLTCCAGDNISAVGEPVVMSGINTVRTAVAGDLLTGAVVGYGQEIASAGEVFEVKLVDTP